MVNSISLSYHSYLTTYITFFLNQIIFFLPKYVLTKSRFLYLGHIICILIPICLSHFFSYLSCQVTFSISKSHFLIPLNLGNSFYKIIPKLYSSYLGYLFHTMVCQLYSLCHLFLTLVSYNFHIQIASNTYVTFFIYLHYLYLGYICTLIS